MASIPTWLRYIAQKTEYSFLVSLKKHEIGRLSDGQIGAAVWRNLFQGRLTSLIFSKGEEMAPTLSPEGETLLVRRFPHVDKRNTAPGNVVDHYVHPPFIFPKFPGRMYFLLGKPISTEEKRSSTTKRSAQAVYSEIKKDVEISISYVLEKREHDPYRHFLPRFAKEAFSDFTVTMPTFDV